MDIHNRHGLKAAASDALRNAPNQKRLILIWAGVGTALPLLISVLSYVLEHQIADTGGLSGIGLRSVLSTIQSLLSLSSSVLLPFWTYGYIAVTLHFAHKKSVSDSGLLEGFRRFGPILRLLLLEILLCAIICIICIEVVSTIISFTPMSAPVYEVLENSQQMLLSGVIDESILDSIIEAMLPIFMVCGMVCAIVLIPVTYRLRLAALCMMDTPGCSALQAIGKSMRLMRRNCFALFRLDLSFWWFYLVKLLVSVLCYGDVILPMLGITLPFSYGVSFFGFYIAALVVQFFLLYFSNNQVQTTYALFYDTLSTPPKRQTDLMV